MVIFFLINVDNNFSLQGIFLDQTSMQRQIELIGGRITRRSRVVSNCHCYGTNFEVKYRSKSVIIFLLLNITKQGIETAKMKCDVDNALGAVPWIEDLSSVNDSAASEETENIRPGVASFCTLEEYQLFDSFFSKFMTIAREFFLPPERHKFGLVSERSMLSALGIGDSSSWLAVLYFAGCPSCSKIIKIEGDLSNALQMDSSVVKEVSSCAQNPVAEACLCQLCKFLLWLLIVLILFTSLINMVIHRNINIVLDCIPVMSSYGHWPSKQY